MSNRHFATLPATLKKVSCSAEFISASVDLSDSVEQLHVIYGLPKYEIMGPKVTSLKVGHAIYRSFTPSLYTQLTQLDIAGKFRTCFFKTFTFLELKLYNFHSLGPQEDIFSILRLPALKELTLREFWKVPEKLASIPSLTRLSLYPNGRNSLDDFQNLPPSITNLCIGKATLTDTHLLDITRQLGNLRHLQLDKCETLNGSARMYLRNAGVRLVEEHPWKRHRGDFYAKKSSLVTEVKNLNSSKYYPFGVPLPERGEVVHYTD